MTRRVLLLPAISIVLVAGLATGCTSGGGGDASSLTIYSGRNQELIEPLVEQFTDATGIDTAVRYGDSADLALLIDAEGDNAPADVFISQSPGAIGFLDADDRLRELPDSVLDLVESAFRADDGRWVGTSGRIRTLVYNPDLVSEEDLPASVFDLTDPRYEGQVGIAPTNGSFQDFVTTMRSAVGDDETRDWLDGMEANDARGYANNLVIVDAVARGEIAMGLVNHYYQARAKAENPDLAAKNYFFSDGDLGALVLVTAAGILDTAKNPDAGEQFVEFLLSKKAQKYYAEQTFEYPLARGVAAPANLPALDSIESPAIGLSDLGGGLEETRRMIAQSGLEQS